MQQQVTIERKWVTLVDDVDVDVGYTSAGLCLYARIIYWEVYLL